MSCSLLPPVNGSCGPKPAVAQLEPPFAPELWRSLGAVALCVVVGAAFAVWLWRYRLRYLLRILTLLLFVTSVHGFYSNLRGSVSTDFCRIQLFFSVEAFWLLVLVLRYFWGMPIDIRKDAWSVGFAHLDAQARARGTTRYQLARQRVEDPGDVPPVYPNGWLPILESRELAKGQVASVSPFGLRLCVFRGMSGEVYVLDAYCPHLGADLAAGGRVEGERIECPFHGWQFSGRDGACQRIPYTSHNVPDVARAKTRPSREVNGFIYLWYHAEQEDPSWEIPVLEPLQTGQWVYRGRTVHQVHCHIQEIPENGADVAHLHQLHSDSVFLGSRFTEPSSWLNFAKHKWTPHWRQDGERAHVGRISLEQRMEVFGFDVPLSTLSMDIEQIGPATVHLHLKTSFGRGVLIQHIISDGPLTQRIVHHLYTEPSFRQFPSNLLMRAEAIMLERDIYVWNNKKYQRNPVLVSEDRLINRYRRWYQQFYSPNSPTLRAARERSLEW